MTTTTAGEAVPNEEPEECSCHCHQPVYCPECNQPVGPLEERKESA